MLCVHIHKHTYTPRLTYINTPSLLTRLIEVIEAKLRVVDVGNKAHLPLTMHPFAATACGVRAYTQHIIHSTPTIHTTHILHRAGDT